jgi:pimeloyl-ACP methyl ester carboxylesterase
VSALIASCVARLPPGVRIHLVGHSLGGLAVRWFVQETESDPRVVQTISVAAPFAGARGAWLFPGPAGRDMQRGSNALRRLAVTASIPDLPHVSIFGGADTAVAPDTTFSVGERVLVPEAGHNGLLFHEDVVEQILRRITTLRAAQP